MHITYELLLAELKKLYRNYKVYSLARTFFVNDDNEVVASYDDHSINMYFKFPECSPLIWNHYGLVVAAFAKDFKIKDNEYADCIMIEGLCGACNYIDVFASFGAETSVMDSRSTASLFQKLPVYSGTGIRRHDEVYNSCGDLLCTEQGDIIIKIGDIDIRNLKASKLENPVFNVVNIHDTATFDYNDTYENWYERHGHYYIAKPGYAAAVSPDFFLKKNSPNINYSSVVRNKTKPMAEADEYKDDMYNDMVSKKFK